MSNIELVNSSSSTIKDDVQENNLTTLIKNLNDRNEDVKEGNNPDTTSVVLYNPATNDGEYICSNDDEGYQASDSSVELSDNINNDDFLQEEDTSFFSFSSLVPDFLLSNNSEEPKDIDENLLSRMFSGSPMIGVTVDLGKVDTADQQDENCLVSDASSNYSELSSSEDQSCTDIVDTVNEKIFPMFHVFKHAKNIIYNFFGVDYEGKQIEKEFAEIYNTPLSSIMSKETDDECFITPDSNDDFSYIKRISPLLNSQRSIKWIDFSSDISLSETENIKNKLESEFLKVNNSNKLSDNFLSDFTKSEYVLNNSFLKNCSLDKFVYDLTEKISEVDEQKMFSAFASKTLFEVPNKFIEENYPEVHSYDNEDPIYRYEFVKLNDDTFKVIATKIVQSNEMDEDDVFEKHMFGIKTSVIINKYHVSDIDYKILVK